MNTKRNYAPEIGATQKPPILCPIGQLWHKSVFHLQAGPLQPVFQTKLQLLLKYSDDFGHDILCQHKGFQDFADLVSLAGAGDM